MRVLVLGAGAMGLAAALRAAQLGHEVDLVEADAKAGGMAAHFDFAGISIERFYHFVCKSDATTFGLMEELGIGDKMRWTPTSMGYYMGGAVHDWGTPLSLLKFPHLDWISKFRYGLQMFLSTKRTDWTDLDKITVREWVERGAGKRAYDVLWRKLLELKFFEFADDVSAAWIWTRVKRVGTSRKSMMQEELGYIEGGSETLVKAMVSAFTALGGRLHLATPVQQVLTENGKVTGVLAGGQTFPADAVISTVPAPLVPSLVPDLPDTSKAAYSAIPNIGVVCVMLRLKRQVSKHFWVNIVDPAIDIPGFIEFSNLRPVDAHIVYVPYYMPVTHQKWAWADEQFVTEAFGYLRRVNPALTEADLLDGTVGRLKYAQPVCGPRFLETLPAIQTPIAGLQAADTCYYYPEDRGISESVRIGRIMAEAVPA
ncbi:NAD(P)/FAD-dependent oxidoreductase [Acidisoma silvae]|uniref:NAD(P)/FAD-dependent oxidoreductase n=1 Tax=Acidisoma silvae TaxID=2802396 RepID=A0A964E1B0_9PROT|nr:NAD(P)/FAD-dependent oxidoreductase [Acidisoma silvae]MCB8878385.1 NAD(P)/FAD-dependent oxidoreductase [Acidisoma silvae]